MKDACSVDERCQKEVWVRFLLPAQQTSSEEVGNQSDTEPPDGDEERLGANKRCEHDGEDIERDDAFLEVISVVRVLEDMRTKTLRTMEEVCVGRDALQ